MLSFSAAELEQVDHVGESKWFGMLKQTSSPANKSAVSGNVEGVNKSFAELLIQYVDRESKPKHNLKFDLNKKTDSPVNENSISANSSESAIKFFNSNLVSSNSASSNNLNSSDLNLVNRGASLSTTTTNSISGLSSPAVANSFLEQILK